MSTKCPTILWGTGGGSEVNGILNNPYNTYVANRTVEGKQQIVVWHIDYLKLLYVSYRVNTYMIRKLQKIYSKDMTARQ